MTADYPAAHTVDKSESPRESQRNTSQAQDEPVAGGECQRAGRAHDMVKAPVESDAKAP